MKNKILILFLLANTILFAQEFKTPMDYLSFIGKEQENISKSTWKYTSAVAHSKSARRIDATRKQLLKSVENTTKKISNLKNGYNGDIEYRDQVLTYLQFVANNLNEEYDKIIDMQEVAEQSYDFMEAYITARDLINKKLDEEFEKVSLAQKTFALKYKINLVESETELGKKMKISGEVFDYHTAIYLLFFKANITDTNLSKAIEAKDLASIQQNASSLISYSDEGIEKLKTIQPYKKDASLINSTKKTLEYYKKQAEQYVPNVINFLMFQEKFDNAKKSIESKSKSDITKDEVDNYNTMVKQVNKEIENYNKINNQNFQEKNQVINNWNNTGENFISSHIPQD